MVSYLFFLLDFNLYKNLKTFLLLDDEDVVCSVVLENISGSARTDYKSNHMYIEKYKSKRKNPEQTQVLHKRTKRKFN